MIREYLAVLLISFFLLTSLACGDRMLEEIQQFKPNQIPEIKAFTSDVATGTAMEPNMVIHLSAEATDPEGEELRYEYKSDYGFFQNQLDTGNTSTVTFITNDQVRPNIPVTVTLTVSDPKESSVVQILEIGEGNSGPSVSTSAPADRIKSDSTVGASFTSSGSGFYQVHVVDDPNGTATFDTGKPATYCSAGSTVNFTLYGSDTASHLSPRLFPGTAGDRIVIVVLDAMGQEGSGSFTIINDDDEPIATATPGSLTSADPVSVTLDTHETLSSDLSYVVSTTPNPADPNFTGNGTVVAGPLASIVIGSAGDNQTYYVKYVARDSVGNVGPIGSATYRIFAAAPSFYNVTTSRDFVSTAGYTTSTLSWTCNMDGDYTITANGSVRLSGRATADVPVDSVIQASWLASGNNTITITVTGDNLQVGQTTDVIHRDDTAAGTNVITAPTAGNRVRQSTTISANAIDSESGIEKVEFFVDGPLHATDTATPYSYNWDTTLNSNGNHNLTIRTTNGAGVAATTAATVVYVDNAVPSVNLTAPASGARVNNATTISATANDNDSIKRVEFHLYPEGTMIDLDTTAPYSISWNANAATEGNHTLRATAYDQADNTAISEIPIYVDKTNPIANVETPDNGNFLKGNNVFEVSASDPNGGTIARVDLLIDGALCGQKTAAPFLFDVNTANYANTTHNISARAFDSAGNQVLDDDTTVTFDNVNPSVNITSHINGDNVRGNAVSVAISASDNTSVSKVELYIGANPTPVATFTAEPYTYVWNTTSGSYPDGSYALRAIAYDAAGNIDTDNDTTVIVDNTNPTVSITVPAPGALLKGTITIAATPSDPNPIDRVEFYVDGTAPANKVGEDATTPYSTLWVSSTEGAHTLYAMAFDKAGNSITSAPVGITIDNGPPTDVAITDPLHNGIAYNVYPVKATATDTNLDKIEVYVAGALIGSCSSSPCTVNWDTESGSYPNGTYTVHAVATDKVGNTVAGPSINAVVENMAPIYWGDTSDNTARSMVVNKTDGSIYVTGTYVQTIEPHTPITTVNVTTKKFSATGEALWSRMVATRIDGTGYGVEYSHDIAIDANGDIYIVGETTGDLVDPPGSYGGSDAFVIKYASSGTLVWKKQFGTANVDSAGSIAIIDNMVYVTGVMNEETFIVKYDTDGNVLVGPLTYNDSPAVDGIGEMAISGSIGSEMIHLVSLAGTGLQYYRFSSTCTKLNWVAGFQSGPQLGASIGSIATNQEDGTQYVYIVGGSKATTFCGQPMPNPAHTRHDAYIAKIGLDGTTVWCRRFGSTDDLLDRTSGIEIINNSIYVSGVIGSLPSTTRDAFIAKYDLGGICEWTRYASGAGADNASGLSAKNDMNIFISGTTDSNPFYGNANVGGTDCFILRYNHKGDMY